MYNIRSYKPINLKEIIKMLKNNKNRLNDLDVLKAGKKAGRKAGKVAGEFKEFISRGNVTDMAVGIIVGSAFTAIARSFADDVLMPLMGLLMGGIDLTRLSFTINSLIFREYSVTIAYGNFLQAIVGFFIIAVSVFFMVKGLNIVRRKKDETPEDISDTERQLALLTEIRDLLQSSVNAPTGEETDSPVD